MGIPKKIVWLASYPKSGNTWFRAFLTALLNDGKLDINEMKTDGIFSSRQLFDNCTDLDATYLTDQEVKILQPEIFNFLATATDKERLFIKVHDAYTLNQAGLPIIPDNSTLCALYFIRNPLDIAASLANHTGRSIDHAIKLMNDPSGTFSTQKNNLNTKGQLTQLLLSWSGHVESWTDKPAFKVMVIRYEDMFINPVTTFTNAINFLGIYESPEKIDVAIRANSFENLRIQEKSQGFSEKGSKNRSFFRKGGIGNWEKELNSRQIEEIYFHHSRIMTQYGYSVTETIA